MKEFQSSEVEAVFNGYSEEVRKKLLDLRQLIFETAARTAGVGELEKTLKWGQPGYLTQQPKCGSTIRIDQIKSAPGHYAIYFHCRTTLVETFRQLYADDLAFEGNRAVVFDVGRKIPEAIVQHCIALALTYHLHKSR